MPCHGSIPPYVARSLRICPEPSSYCIFALGLLALGWFVLGLKAGWSIAPGGRMLSPANSRRRPWRPDERAWRVRVVLFPVRRGTPDASGGREPCAFIARQESNARGSGRSDAWNRFRKRSWSPSIAELTTIREDQTFLRNLSHASAPTSRHAVSQPQSRRRAIATPNIPVGHGNRSLRRLAVSPPGTGCGGSAAACWGAQESAIVL